MSAASNPALREALRKTATRALRDVVRCHRLARASDNEAQRDRWTSMASLYLIDRLEVEASLRVSS
jgi:hypothetical protein